MNAELLRNETARVPFVAATVALAAALLVAPIMGGAADGVRPVLAALVVAGLTMTLGRALAPFVPRASSAPLLLVEVVLGYGAASLLHLSFTAALNLDALGALGVDVVVAAVVWHASRARRAGPSGASAGRAVQIASLVACAAIAALWARETIYAVPTARASGIFPAWQDYYLHGAEVSYLRDYPVYGGHSQYLTAVPQPLYHRASFSLAALLSAIGDVPSLSVATAYWLPTGLMLCLCALFTWGAAMGGTVTGLGAVAAVFLAPDASTYWLENHFLSFHWLMQMASGSGYALALVLIGLTAAVSAPPDRRVGAGAAAVSLAVAALAFRVHVALLAFAMLVWYGVLTWRPRVSPRVVVGGATALAALGGVVYWMESVALAPHFLSGRSHPVLFFLSVHTQANDLPSPFRAWREGHGDVAQVLGGYALMLLAGCGASLVALAGVWITGVFSRMGRAVWAVPVSAALANLSVILLVPTPAHADITDFGHRPFVLVYIVIGGLAGAGLAFLLTEWSTRRFRSTTPPAAVMLALAAAGMTIPWHDGERIQQHWVPAYALLPVPREAFPAADYIRAHSSAEEQIVSASGDRHAFYVAATERRAWLSRKSLFETLGPPTASVAGVRERALAQVASPRTIDDLRAFGHREGVSWYIADLPTTMLWPDTVRDYCAYCGDEIRVYDLRDSPPR